MNFRIERVWAFLSREDDGDESVIGLKTAHGWVAMIAADETRLGQLRQAAERIAAESGRPITLVHFSVRTDVETIGAGGS